MRWGTGFSILLFTCAIILFNDFSQIWRNLPIPRSTRQAWSVITGYIFILAILGALLPGKSTKGVYLRESKTCLNYKCNGLLLTGVVVTTLVAAVWNDYVSGFWIVDHYSELFGTANLFALTLSVYLFVAGRLYRTKNWLRRPSVIEDFILGAELNPHVLGLDVKFFSYRPSMTGWLLINISFLMKQYDLLGFVTGRMLLYQVLTAWYIWDYFVHETKMVYTWDIIEEHFGFMLVWGDYVFIPFGFSVQNFFLLRNTAPLSYVEIWIILAIFAVGYAVFRGANSQKHRFKADPTASVWGKPPITIGGRLLASGFWGMGRHMNYTGDLLLALSYCLPCGFRSGSLPYFYFIYLLLLAVHREKRDDDRCAAKYKSLWEEYRLRVPYRMLPFVY